MDMSKQVTEAHVVIESTEQTAIDALQNETGLPRQRIKSAMTKGAVWLTRGSNTSRLRRATRKLRVGDEVHLYYDPQVLDEQPPQPILVADVGAYSAWNKPYGLRSQGSKWGDHCTVTRWAERHLQPERPAFVVHRLDRAANGLILVAHTKTMAAALSALFRERKIEKRYRVIVAGDFSAQPKPLRIESPVNEKTAISEFSLVRVTEGNSELDVRIETGRKHQIRRHLAELGFPVIGDRLYGSGESDGKDLQLTAYLLAFECPVAGERVEYRLGVATPQIPPR
ncbi:RNA pseudouridine synthase [Woeseia oceani]|uniref:RNA pseudouridine synthase n=2 Tax=Woeseia oceani TaxID=1548547 RepID=A0A193LHG2_9GAMM|nr:RNA pseudouridine synthase [Woeseia oceani]